MKISADAGPLAVAKERQIERVEKQQTRSREDQRKQLAAHERQAEWVERRQEATKRVGQHLNEKA